MRGLQGLTQLRAALQAAAPRSSSASSVEAAWQSLQRASIVSTLHGGLWGQIGHSSSQPGWAQQPRHFSDELGANSASEQMPEGYFHKIVDHTLDDLLERLEYFVEEADLAEADVEYSQGVLTLQLGDLGTYVINKQTPNRQVWMSSPLSGPVRYDWAPGKWVYHRDGHDLHARLSNELRQLTGHELDLSPCFACGKLNTCQGEQCSKGLQA